MEDFGNEQRELANTEAAQDAGAVSSMRDEVCASSAYKITSKVVTHDAFNKLLGATEILASPVVFLGGLATENPLILMGSFGLAADGGRRIFNNSPARDDLFYMCQKK